VSVLSELNAVRRDAEILQEAGLKLILEYLPVAVHDELASDEVEHDPSPRPFLIFSFMDDAGHAVRRPPSSPTFPEVVVAVRAGEKIAVFFGVGESAAVSNQANRPRIVPHKPVRSDEGILWDISNPLRHRCHSSLLSDAKS
jgi:hypothetical protein